jgi:hypothetical protein
MFDLISGGPRHPFHDPTVTPTVVSIVGHGVVLSALAIASIFATSDRLPDIPDMLAFVAVPAPAPPPPPPTRSVNKPPPPPVRSDAGKAPAGPRPKQEDKSNKK